MTPGMSEINSCNLTLNVQKTYKKYIHKPLQELCWVSYYYFSLSQLLQYISLAYKLIAKGVSRGGDSLAISYSYCTTH